ncbi:ABC transporter [Streptomyces nodosus]
MRGIGGGHLGIRDLAPPVWRGLPRRALGVACGLGPVLVGLARLIPGELDGALALVLMRCAALVSALGLACVLDDPARHSTATVPTRRPVRSALRMAQALPLAALSWTAALLLVPGDIRPPAGDLALEAAALTALALAGAAAAVRFTEAPQPGPGVAVLLLMGTVLALLLPERWCLFARLGSPLWAEAHQRWAVLLLLTVPMVALLLPEPIRRTRLPAVAHR